MNKSRTGLRTAGALLAATALLGACGSDSSSSSSVGGTSTTASAGSTTTGTGGSQSTAGTTASGSSTTTGASSSGSGLAPADLTSDFSAMATLKDVASRGTGKIAVLLPDTSSSARYVEFDEPFFKQAFEAAGLSSSDFSIDNAGGDASTMQTQAEAAITDGASVIIIDPLDSGSAAAIEKNATAKGVKVIDYDRLVLGGASDRVYISFDNVEVGKLIGNGFVQCVTDWKVDKPQVLIMDGDPTDNNATQFAKGYNSVLDPKFSSGDYTKVGEPGGTWDAQKALTLFEQQFTAHPEINATVNANDGLGGAVISALKTQNIPAKTFPVTGQDATVAGLQNVLLDYQCGSVYKPIYAEVQAAVTVALYLRAGEAPPTSLVTATTTDTDTKDAVQSALLTPTWVTSDNMASTVIADKFVKVSDLCTSDVKDACTAAGIK